MRLYGSGKNVLTLKKHGNKDSVVGRMAVAIVGIIVEIRVTLLKIWVVSAHGSSLQIAAPNVDWEALSSCQNFVVLSYN
jgi:hypothetical protein